MFNNSIIQPGNSSTFQPFNPSTLQPPLNPSTDIEVRSENSQDASGLLSEKIADAVVFPETIEQVQEVVRFANVRKIPVICRGAGTNVVGACLPENGGIVLNFSQMDSILEINTENMTARVQPGVVVGDLHKAVEEVGLFYPPDPAYLAFSTIGGSIAQSSAGAKTFKYGSTKDYVLDLLVVTPDGELLKTGSNTIKNATGYDLNRLFVGSEGTLGIVVEAVLKLIPKPESQQVLMAYFNSVSDAVSAVNGIISRQIFPAALDLMDKNALRTVETYSPSGILTDKAAALVIEIDGFECSMEYQRKVVVEVLEQCKAAQIRYSSNNEEYDKIWAARRSSMKACEQLKPNVTTDDVIVPRDRLAQLVEGVQRICEKHNLICCLIGHVGDGSVHPQIPVDFSDKDEMRRYKLAKNEIYELTVHLGGTLSGEHGIGVLKRDYMHKVVDPLALRYMREIKKVFDPHNILNPGKIF
jgi:glycolate oxidase